MRICTFGRLQDFYIIFGFIQFSLKTFHPKMPEKKESHKLTGPKIQKQKLKIQEKKWEQEIQTENWQQKVKLKS